MKSVDIQKLLETQSEFTEEEFSSLLKEHELANKGNGADVQTVKEYGDTLTLTPAEKQHAWESESNDSGVSSITSETDLSTIQKNNEEDLKRRNINPPQPLETIQGKVYFDAPFIAQQAKKLPKTTRIRQKVVKVFDLSNQTDLEEFNTLLNHYIFDFSNIANLNHQVQIFESANTWKVLASYDILEFQNPFSN